MGKYIKEAVKRRVASDNNMADASKPYLSEQALPKGARTSRPTKVKEPQTQSASQDLVDEVLRQLYRRVNSFGGNVAGQRVGLNSIASAVSAEVTFGSTDGSLTSSPQFTYAIGTSTLTVGDNVLLARDAANALAQRNGTNAQTFRVYNTFTDLNNYERINVAWLSNVATLEAARGGTGSARNISFATNGSHRWQVDATGGHFIAAADNTYDIGASGANRPRTGYFGTSVVSPAYTVGATAGASFNGAITNITVVNGIVTAAS